MTLDETIQRLIDLKEVVGGSTPFCIQKDSTSTTDVTVFEPASVEVYSVVDMTCDANHPLYACLLNGNTSKIVAVFY